jgi:metal transporter CNNM
MAIITWGAILLCLSQSALLSGLTLGFFGLSRLRLEILAEAQDKSALRILSLRKNANLLLSTLLWANVSVNVLFTLLTDSVVSGVAAFLISTVGITVFAEIIPQAYFNRHALRAGAFLVPLVKTYQFFLYPIAKPSSKLLDLWLGKEGPLLFNEKEFHLLLRKHFQSPFSDIGSLEGMGAANFLAMDDVFLEQEGEPLDPASLLVLPTEKGRPVFPAWRPNASDPFLLQVAASGKKWVILTDLDGTPTLALDARAFLNRALMHPSPVDIFSYCHRPILITTPGVRLGSVIRKFRVHPERGDDDVVDQDLILYWGKEKRIVTGADILGRLLRGIVPVAR